MSSIKSQTKSNCIAIEINDSLFNSNTISYHGYLERNGMIAKNKHDNNVTQIDSVFKIKDGCLNFVLSVSLATLHPHTFSFVTDNKMKIKDNIKYYSLKVIVDKNDETAAIDAKPVKIDLSTFNIPNDEAIYLKINNINQFLKIN